jgi:nitrogen fixation protein FixH
MMTPKVAGKQKAKLSGRHVLGAMLAFFAVIVTADAIMIYQAVSTFGGVDNANAYRDGLAYNDRIARERRQAGLGWKEAVELRADPERIRVELKNAAGAGVGGIKVAVTLVRAVTSTADFVVDLAEVSPGVFEAPVASVREPGAWVATVRAFGTDNDQTEPLFETRRRLWVAP